MPKPLLSIGMIVKDEIRCIEKCLKALQPLRDAYPCELVIADTGSTDGTREVAAQYADILFDFVWIDDFAAARNAVMDRCSGTWYFSVDADEYLDGDLSGFQELFKLSPDKRPTLCGVTVRNYLGFDLEHDSYVSFIALRMARLDKGARYSGAIHEAITFPDKKDMAATLCPSIILRHDGYVFSSAEQARKKSERNLALLDKYLAEHSEDKRCLMECLEAARSVPGQVLKYAIPAMELIRGAGEDAQDPWDPLLAARCAAAALTAQLPEGPEWMDWCLERYPDAAIVRLDAAYAGLAFYYSRKDYGRAISLAQVYLDAMEDERAGRIPPKERIFAVFQSASDQCWDKARSIMAVSLCKLGRVGEALPYLIGWQFEKASAVSVNDWLRAMALLEDLPGAAEEMARALPLLEPEGDDRWRKERWRGVLPLLRQFFKPGWGAAEGAEHPWRLLLGCSGPLGQGARVMACTNTAEAEQLLTQVGDWENFPPEALLHALTLGAGIPAGLCAQRPDVRLGLITAMAQSAPDFARHMAQYPWETAGNLHLLQMQFDLVTCAVQRIAPLRDAMDGPILCRILHGKLAELSRDLLPRLYHPELLENHVEWTVLPGTYQFCLWLLEGEKKRAAGDIPGYLRDLRQGLKQAPGMKDLTEFLLDEVEKEAETAPPVIDATPELLALAEQVKRILSQFPPDDPAVLQLKASPAYQRVAFLLEDPASPVLM